MRNGVRSEVLKDVSLQIAPGEILGLVGESGSGKSVLALSLLGLLPRQLGARTPTAPSPSAGPTCCAPKPAELRRVRRDKLGAIFQDPMTSLNPTMRIGGQIGEVTHDDAESVRLLETVGVRDAELRLQVYPHELSGGLRQRVMAAIAVAGRPGLIVADEPTTALDVTVQAQLLDLLRELRDDFGCSVLMITHDLGVADQIADRLAVLYRGELVEIGKAADVVRNPQHDYTRSLLASRLTLTMPRDERFTARRPRRGARAVQHPRPAPHVQIAGGAAAAVTGNHARATASNLDIAAGRGAGDRRRERVRQVDPAENRCRTGQTDLWHRDAHRYRRPADGIPGRRLVADSVAEHRRNTGGAAARLKTVARPGPRAGHRRAGRGRPAARGRQGPTR